jgi:hypothetical protein
MRTTLSNLVRVAMVIATTGVAHRAHALEDAVTLRCEASVVKAEARYFDCASHCQVHADYRAAAGIEYDRTRCDDRCEGQYDDTVSRSGCAASFPDRVAAPSSVGMDAGTLACHGVASAIESKLLRCVAKCAVMIEISELRGFAFDAQGCVDGCTAEDDAAVARVEAKGECDLDDAAQ